MDFTIDRDDFKAALGAVKGTAGNTAQQILSHVLIDADTGVKLRTTDLENLAAATVSAEVKSAGSCTMEAKRLSDFVSTLPCGNVRVKAATSGAVEVSLGKVKAKLSSLPVGDFPAVDDHLVNPVVVELDAAVLGEALDSGMFCIASDNFPNGMEFKATDGTLSITSTDGHRLSVAKLTASCDKLGSITLGEKGLTELRRALRDGPVTAAFGANMATFTLGATSITIRAIDQAYPDASGVIPDNPKCSFTLDRERLLDSLRRMAIVADGVKLDVRESALRMSASSPRGGEMSDELAIDWPSEPLSVGFRCRYLIEPLVALRGKAVTLSFVSKEHPALIRGENANILHCVMPMRL